jgi:chromosome segregation ATPase
MEHMLTQLIGMVGKLMERMDAVELRLDKIEHRLDRVEQRLDQVEHRLDRVESEVADMKRNVEYAADTSKYLLGKFAQHDRDIEVFRQKLA